MTIETGFSLEVVWERGDGFACEAPGGEWVDGEE